MFARARARLAQYERVVYRHGAILSIVRECNGFIPRRFRPHGSWWAGQRTSRLRDKVEAREGEEEDKARKQQTLKHVMTCAWRCDTLSHNVMCTQGQTCREKLSCEVYLSTHPVGYSGSLSTVKRNQLTVTKRNSLKKMWAHYQFLFQHGVV